ncbi:unnamed protein product, partial [Rotaria magnacalcarata]
IQHTAVGTATAPKHGSGESTGSDEKWEVSKARKYGHKESTEIDALCELWMTCKQICAESRKTDKMCESSRAHKHGRSKSWKAHKHGRSKSWKAHKHGRIAIESASTESAEKVFAVRISKNSIMWAGGGRLSSILVVCWIGLQHADGGCCLL